MPRRWEIYGNEQLPRDSLINTPIEAHTQFGWEGGWQPDKPLLHLGPDELSVCKNFKWNESYGLERRLGCERVSDTISGMDQAHIGRILSVWTSSSLSAQPSFTQQVHYFNDDDGELWDSTLGGLLIEEFDDSGTDLVYSGQSMGGWSSGATNYFRTWNIASVVFEDKIYVTGLRFGGYSGVSTDETHNGSAGASKPIKHDVLNDTFVRPLPHPLDGTATGFPTARTAIATYDRIFVGNLYFQGTYRYPSRIYWSDAGTAETWGANSFIEIGLDDGSEITGLLETGDAIVIFKDNSMWLLLGTDEDSFALRNLSPELGCRSSQGFAYHDGLVYWFDPNQGLMMWDGANFTNISEPINDTMLTQANYQRQADFRVNVQAYDNRIFVSLPTGNDHQVFPTHTYVYDTRWRVWTEYDFGFASDLSTYVTDHSHTGVGIADTGQAYFTSPNDDIGLFRLEGNLGEDQYDGGDSNIAAQMTTGWFAVGEPGNRNRIRRFEAMTNANLSGGWDLSLYRDFENTTKWQSYSWTPSGSTQDAEHEQETLVDVKTGFSWLKVDLIVNDADDTYHLHGYQLMFSSRRRPRGVSGELGN